MRVINDFDYVQLFIIVTVCTNFIIFCQCNDRWGVEHRLKNTPNHMVVAVRDQLDQLRADEVHLLYSTVQKVLY